MVLPSGQIPERKQAVLVIVWLGGQGQQAEGAGTGQLSMGPRCVRVHALFLYTALELVAAGHDLGKQGRQAPKKNMFLTLTGLEGDTWGASIVVPGGNVATHDSNIPYECWFKACLLCFQGSFLLMHGGMQQKMM